MSDNSDVEAINLDDEATSLKSSAHAAKLLYSATTSLLHQHPSNNRNAGTYTHSQTSLPSASGSVSIPTGLSTGAGLWVLRAEQLLTRVLLPPVPPLAATVSAHSNNTASQINASASANSTSHTHASASGSGSGGGANVASLSCSISDRGRVFFALLCGLTSDSRKSLAALIENKKHIHSALQTAIAAQASLSGAHLSVSTAADKKPRNADDAGVNEHLDSVRDGALSLVAAHLAVATPAVVTQGASLFPSTSLSSGGVSAASPLDDDSCAAALDLDAKRALAFLKTITSNAHNNDMASLLAAFCHPSIGTIAATSAATAFVTAAAPLERTAISQAASSGSQATLSYSPLAVASLVSAFALPSLPFAYTNTAGAVARSGADSNAVANATANANANASASASGVAGGDVSTPLVMLIPTVAAAAATPALLPNGLPVSFASSASANNNVSLSSAGASAGVGKQAGKAGACAKAKQPQSQQSRP